MDQQKRAIRYPDVNTITERFKLLFFLWFEYERDKVRTKIEKIATFTKIDTINSHFAKLWFDNN